jgi:hypothetical protein
MNNNPQPPASTPVVVVPEVGDIFNSTIEYILGQWIYVKSAGRFHWRDDNIGPNKWAANDNIFIIR